MPDSRRGAVKFEILLRQGHLLLSSSSFIAASSLVRIVRVLKIELISSQWVIGNSMSGLNSCNDCIVGLSIAIFTGANCPTTPPPTSLFAIFHTKIFAFTLWNASLISAFYYSYLFNYAGYTSNLNWKSIAVDKFNWIYLIFFISLLFLDSTQHLIKTINNVVLVSFLNEWIRFSYEVHVSPESICISADGNWLKDTGLISDTFIQSNQDEAEM